MVVVSMLQFREAYPTLLQSARASTGSMLRPAFCSSTAQRNSFGQCAPLVASVVHESLAEGASVGIENRTFKIRRKIGSGSFGAVWEAEERRGLAAIKEMTCRSKRALDMAVREAEILRKVGGADSSSTSVSTNLLQIFAMETRQVGPSEWRVRLAMNRLPGKPLDEFLDKDVIAGDAPAILNRFRFGHELLVQLAPVMSHIVSCDVLHRDAHARNILVDQSADGLRFSLVDFGLAADLGDWQQGGWTTKDVAGDCRYWPASAWFFLQYGAEEMLKLTALRSEYEARLDLHSLGLTVVQTIVGSNMPDACDAARIGVVLYLAVVDLQRIWQQFWKDAERHWLRVYQAFRQSGADTFEKLRRELIAEGVHDVMRTHYASLRMALLNLRASCLHPTSSADFSFVVELVDASMIMISDLSTMPELNGPLRWPELNGPWRCIQSLLGSSTFKKGDDCQKASSRSPQADFDTRFDARSKTYRKLKSFNWSFSTVASLSPPVSPASESSNHHFLDPSPSGLQEAMC